MKTIIRKIGQRLRRGRAATPPEPEQKATQSSASAPKDSGPEQPPRRSKPRKHTTKRPQPETPETPETPWSADSFQVPPRDGLTRFHDLDLPVEIMHGVADLGFEYCTPVQAMSLPPALAGKNVEGQAQTGTGKTAAFLIAIFTRFLRGEQQGPQRKGQPRALIIAPTRELVIQLTEDAKHVGKYCPFRCLAVYGGMDYRKQERMLDEKPVDVIAATPGRLLDFKGRGRLDLSKVEVLVIDEADRMLDMGFIPDVRRIINSTPPRERRQTLLFSATLTDDVRRLAHSWMPNPVAVEIEPERLTVDTVEQHLYSVTARDKFKLLYNMLESHHMKRVLVFANRRTSTRRLAETLDRHGISCEVLSGDVEQKKRLRILEQFREGEIRVMVATDVAARGLHIEGVTHVVNYEFPYEPESYVHRIGRTGRAGALGTAISFACEDESFIIPEIEAYIGHALPCEQPAEELLKPTPRPTKPPPSRSDRDRPPRSPSRQGQGRRSGGGSGRGSSRARPTRRRS